MLILSCMVIALASGSYLYLSPGLPQVDNLKEIKLQIPLRIFSSDGKMIGEFGEKWRDPIAIADTPQAIINAILAAEDDRFYHHRGVSIRSLVRAASQLLVSGEIQSGGSTITMQVARNFFLTRTQTFSRKFNEILLALKIEQQLTKEEILELYLNKVYLGNRAYGFKAASQVYYGKPLAALTLAQTAMIAGLPKAPSTYNPIVNPTRALVRRDWILGRMLGLKLISQADYDAAIAAPVTARYHGQRLDVDAPYIAEMARIEAIRLFGDSAYIDGYHVITTVDSRLQQQAQQALINGLTDYSNRHGYHGPEKTFELGVLRPSKSGSGTAAISADKGGDKGAAKTAIPANADVTPWINLLKEIPVYGGLRPAAVIGLQDKQVSAILDSGRTINIPWENGLKSAQPYINENTRGRKPRRSADILALGDVIRVRQDQAQRWHLGQVPKAQAALVALNPNSGAIESLVGGFDFHQSHFNRVTQAKRQPGSNFKPFIYTLALESNLTPASLFNDAPVVIEDFSLESAWRPQNASGEFHGPTRLRQALYLSRNLISIRLLQHIGIDNAVAGVERFGIEPDELPKNLSMALGSHVMTPLEVAVAYSVFANGGYKIEPFLVDSVKDTQGNVVYRHRPPVTPAYREEINAANNGRATAVADQPLPLAARIVDERTVYIMNSMLRDVIARGTGRRARALERRDLAGKTGTTNGPTDAWFTGYNHRLVATAWVGFDNNNKLGRREYGGSAALPIWIDYMKTALEDIPEYLPPPPDGIVTVPIDPDTGNRALAGSSRAIFEIFRKENVPPEGKSTLDREDESTLEEIWID